MAANGIPFVYPSSTATTPNRSIASSWLYRGVSAIDAGRVLKFVDVARDDGIGYGVLKPGAAFTITCHTLPLGSMVLKDRLGRTVWNKRTALFVAWYSMEGLQTI